MRTFREITSSFFPLGIKKPHNHIDNLENYLWDNLGATINCSQLARTYKQNYSADI